MRKYEPIGYRKEFDSSGDFYAVEILNRPRLSVVDMDDSDFLERAMKFLRQNGYYPTGRKDILTLTMEVARGRPYALWCRLGWLAEESFWTVTRLAFRMGLWHRKYWSPGERLRWRDVRPGPSRKKW